MKMRSVACITALMCSTVCAQIEIQGFHENGELSFSPPNTAGSVRIEWAASVTGTWFDTWQWLSNLPVTGSTMTVHVPMFFRVFQQSFAQLSNDLVAIPYDPSDKATYLSNTGLYANGFGTYQKNGPEHTYFMTRYEISNREFVQFLNDAQTNSLNDRGTNMYFHTDGDVFITTNRASTERLFKRLGTRILYGLARPLGQRYYIDPATPLGGGTFDNHPVVQVTWLGAVKYCNWLTLVTGRGAAQRCYFEGPSPSNWFPVTAALWNDGYFSQPERLAWLGYAGFRLPMDRTINVNPYNEYYKAAAWSGSTNTIYAFGRNTYDVHDLNYDMSADFFEGDDPETTPVGFYDGSQHEYFGNLFQTRQNANQYGIYDLAGNVSELSNDFTAEGDPDYMRARGGSWYQSQAVRSDQQDFSVRPYDYSASLGFRIVTTAR